MASEIDRKFSEMEKPIQEPLENLTGFVLPQIDQAIQKVKSKTEKLFECQVKNNFEEKYLPDLEGDLLVNAQKLIESYEALEERRLRTKELLDIKVPDIIKQQRGKIKVDGTDEELEDLWNITQFRELVQSFREFSQPIEEMLETIKENEKTHRELL